MRSDYSHFAVCEIRLSVGMFYSRCKTQKVHRNVIYWCGGKRCKSCDVTPTTIDLSQSVFRCSYIVHPPFLHVFFSVFTNIFSTSLLICSCSSSLRLFPTLPVSVTLYPSCTNQNYFRYYFFSKLLHLQS